MNSTTKAKSDVEMPADFDAIIEDLAALRRDFNALMSQMKAGAFKGASDAAENTIGELGRQVEERPVMSLLIAFGVGFVVSRLLAR